jgi:hypothetical protein
MKPIEEVFRSSGSGALMVKKQTLIKTQLKRIDELLYEKLNGVNAAGNKSKSGQITNS